MNLFIDTNIFLNFYHFSNEDLQELDKLSVTIRNKEIELYLPEQVKDEFCRNRDKIISDALKEFKKEKIERQFPHMTKQYPEFKKMRESIRAFETNRQKLLDELETDIRKNNLKADKLIESLFNKAHLIPLTNAIYNKAVRRFNLRNPPGKDNSYGDAINWESLLACIKQKEDIFIITEDGDYRSAFDTTQCNSFLLNEWIEKKNSNLTLYKSLSTFFKDKFPDIKLAEEQEKNLLIEELFKSEVFSKTNSILAGLAKFPNFSRAQVNDILVASINNPHIYWIGDQTFVNETLHTIANRHLDSLDEKIYEKFQEIFKPVVANS